MENSASGQILLEANSSIRNEITGIPENSRTRSGNGNETERLVIDINSVVQTSEDIRLSNGCRIRKVPYHIRRWNSEAYTPLTAIGPYHNNGRIRSSGRVFSDDRIKNVYSMRFMERAENGIEFRNLETAIRMMADIIRPCYVSAIELSSDGFVRMIVIDATFILELFLKYRLGEWESGEEFDLEGLRIHRVHRELLLLENQLPFFVIKKLYHLAVPSVSNSLPLVQLTYGFFEKWNVRQKAPEGEISHFTELLRFFALPQPDELPQRERRVRFPMYSATRLHEVGVRFEVVPTKFVPDLCFGGGVLGIPLLNFGDDTEALVLNILALEQCCYANERYITDFYLILGRLIKTDNDVKLLSNAGIISNNLSDDSDITSMVKNFTRGISSCNMNSNLLRVCEELNAFCDDPWNRRRLFLRRRYWGAVSVSAIILVLLTLLQTVCSIFQIVPIVKGL